MYKSAHWYTQWVLRPRLCLILSNLTLMLTKLTLISWWNYMMTILPLGRMSFMSVPCFTLEIRNKVKQLNFLFELYEMAEKCEFGDQKEDHIRDRIVTGLSDKELSRELQLKSDLNLNTAVQLVKQRETVKSQLMAQGQSQASALEEVRRPLGRMNINVRKPQSNRDQRCSKCNYKHEGRPCPAKGKQCRKLNHFASCCKRKM